MISILAHRFVKVNDVPPSIVEAKKWYSGGSNWHVVSDNFVLAHPDVFLAPTTYPVDWGKSSKIDMVYLDEPTKGILYHGSTAFMADGIKELIAGLETLPLSEDCEKLVAFLQGALDEGYKYVLHYGI